MNRRIALQTTAATLLVGMAGCLGGDATDEESTDITDMIDDNRVDSATFRRTGDCGQSGSASVGFSGPRATITGCVAGHNGCAEPVVRSAEMADGRFQIVIGEEDLSDSDTICTQQIVTRGYELTIRFVDELPPLEIIHDDVDGRTVITTVDRP